MVYARRILPPLSYTLALLVSATPTGSAVPRHLKRNGVITVSSNTLSSYAPYTQLARATYCPVDKISSWTCGEACDAVSTFQPTLSGGNGDDIHQDFVGYWPDRDTVVVVHQGTDTAQLGADLTDIDLVKVAFNRTLFPGIPDGVKTHSGFAEQHAKTATLILAEVKRLMSSYGTSAVTIVGHSLGGALAELQSLYIKLNILSTQVKGVTYGSPRIGNPAFAAFFNQQVNDFTRINNRDDIVPIIPSHHLGFEHPEGQVHIPEDGTAVACSGDENTDPQCTDGAVKNIFEGSILDHLGPHDGIHPGVAFCT